MVDGSYIRCSCGSHDVHIYDRREDNTRKLIGFSAECTKCGASVDSDDIRAKHKAEQEFRV